MLGIITIVIIFVIASIIGFSLWMSAKASDGICDEDERNRARQPYFNVISGIGWIILLIILFLYTLLIFGNIEITYH